MLEVWKFPLEVTDYQMVEVPAGAIFLSVVEQGSSIVAYTLVNPIQPKVKLPILVRGTGHPIDSNVPLLYHFLGTVTTGDRIRLVWHVFVPKGY